MRKANVSHVYGFVAFFQMSKEKSTGNRLWLVLWSDGNLRTLLTGANPVSGAPPPPRQRGPGALVTVDD